MQEQLGEVDTAVSLVETLVHRLVSLFVQLGVDGGQSEIARRITGSFADVVVVEQHAHNTPVEPLQDLDHNGSNFPVVGRDKSWKDEICRLQKKKKILILFPATRSSSLLFQEAY